MRSAGNEKIKFEETEKIKLKWNSFRRKKNEKKEEKM